MKPPFDSTDPLLKSFVDEAADLPLKAAAEARRTSLIRKKQRRQITFAITMFLGGVCTWQSLAPRDTSKELFAILQIPDATLTNATQATPPSPPTSRHVIVRTEAQARNDPLPLPERLTVAQADVVKAARGLPLLLVRDRSGRVTRIHAIER
jgi:hypothetical protein